MKTEFVSSDGMKRVKVECDSTCPSVAFVSWPGQAGSGSIPHSADELEEYIRVLRAVISWMRQSPLTARGLSTDTDPRNLPSGGKNQSHDRDGLLEFFL